MGRGATGVIGIKLGAGDQVIGMLILEENQDAQVLVLSEKGFGKRSRVKEYTPHARGTKGVRTMNLTEKTGELVAVSIVEESDDLMIITQEGIAIRFAVKDIRIAGRNTQGVRLIKIREHDRIAAVAKVAEKDEDENASSDTPASDNPDDENQVSLFD
jgi:DNA gyrase subunit A